MTVIDLIRELADCDPHKEVIVKIGSNTLAEINKVTEYRYDDEVKIVVDI